MNEVPAAPTYETVEGTEPSPDAPHEARTIRRTNQDGSVWLMTEIEDGLFVQWSMCGKCMRHMTTCSCQGGPQMPDYMKRWRDKRFENSIRHRKRSVPIDEDEASEPEETPDYTTPGERRAIADFERAESSNTRQKVEDGLDSAIEAVRNAQSEEDPNDVGF